MYEYLIDARDLLDIKGNRIHVSCIDLFLKPCTNDQYLPYRIYWAGTDDVVFCV